MVSVNRVCVAGNLTRDPEVRYTSSGKAVADIGLAINNSYVTQSGEKRDDTVFIKVDVWGKQAENVKKYLSKGSPVLVEGRLKYDSWETKEGEKRNQIKISASLIHFLGSRDRSEGRSEGNAYSEAPAAQSAPAAANTIEDDDIPF